MAKTCGECQRPFGLLWVDYGLRFDLGAPLCSDCASKREVSCEKCGESYRGRFFAGFTPTCPTCNPKLEWERLNSDVPSLFVYRAKVPGGWLLCAGSPPASSFGATSIGPDPFGKGDGFHDPFQGAPDAQHAQGVAFYPDPEHEWNGGSLQ